MLIKTPITKVSRWIGGVNRNSGEHLSEAQVESVVRRRCQQHGKVVCCVRGGECNRMDDLDNSILADSNVIIIIS